ncbi:MAG: hypothetical protein U0R76_09780 [Candidatus Nanopelagicales bacterium]
MSPDEGADRPEGYDGEAPGWPRPEESTADTTWAARPTEPVPPAPTVVPDAETTRVGEQPTSIDPTVPPPAAPAPPPPAAPAWGAPTPAPAPDWSTPTPPAPAPGGYGAPPPPGGYAAPPPVAPGWSSPPGAVGPPVAPPYVPGQPLPGVAGWGAVPQAPKPGVIPLRPLGVGEILDGAISYMRRDPKTVLGISAVIAAAIALLQLLLYGSFSTLFDRILTDPAFTNPGSGAEPNTSALAGALGGLGGVAVLVVVVTFLLNTLATGMLTTAMGRAVLGRPVSTSDVWQRARKRFWPLVLLTLLIGLIITAVVGVGFLITGLIAFGIGQGDAGGAVFLAVILVLATIVVTVWLSVRMLLAPVALILESVGPVVSIKRSFALVKGAWWRTFGIYLLATIIAYIVAQVLTIPFSFIGGIIGGVQASGGATANPFTPVVAISASLGTLVSQIVVIPFTAGIVALLYVDRRIRREALDIELARAAGVPGA